MNLASLVDPTSVLTTVLILISAVGLLVSEKSTTDYAYVPSLIAMGSSNLLLILYVFGSTLSSFPIIKSVPLTGMVDAILISVAFVAISVVMLFNIRLTTLVKGEKVKLADEPNFFINEELLHSEARYHGSRRPEFYLNARDKHNQYLLPIDDLDTLTGYLKDTGDVEEGATCCRCNNLKPKFTFIAHKRDFKEADWRPICKDCTEGFVERIIEDEDNYITKELIVSRFV